MNRRKPAQPPVESLLKRVLKDDLPPETEKRLHARLRLFREATAAAEGARSGFLGNGSDFLADRAPERKWGGWRVQNMALTAAAAAFIVLSAAALLLPASGASSPMAESFSAVSTSLHVSQQISRAVRMRCSVDVGARPGECPAYTVDWTPDKTLARLIRPDRVTAKTLVVEGGQVTLVDEISHAARQGKGAGYADDLSFQPIAGILSPADFSRSLQGRWAAADGRRRWDCGENAFSILDRGESGTVEIWVDTCTFLPTRMIRYRPLSTPAGPKEEIAMSIRFSWEIPSVPRVIDLKISGK